MNVTPVPSSLWPVDPIFITPDGGPATNLTGNPPLTTCKDRFWLGFALGVVAWAIVASQSR